MCTSFAGYFIPWGRAFRDVFGTLDGGTGEGHTCFSGVWLKQQQGRDGIFKKNILTKRGTAPVPPKLQDQSILHAQRFFSYPLSSPLHLWFLFLLTPTQPLPHHAGQIGADSCSNSGSGGRERRLRRQRKEASGYPTANQGSSCSGGATTSWAPSSRHVGPTSLFEWHSGPTTNGGKTPSKPFCPGSLPNNRLEPSHP